MTECHTIHSCHKDNINRAYYKIKNPFNLTLPHTYMPVTHIFTLHGMYTNDVPLSSSLNSARTPRRRRNSFPVGNTRIFKSFTQLSDVQRHISFHEQKRDFLSRGRGFPGMPNVLSCSTEEHVWGYGRAVMRMRGGMFRHDEKGIRGTEEPFSHDERL